MTVQEFVARQVERIAGSFVEFLETTHASRLAWEPPGEAGVRGRSALELAAECADVNRMRAALLRGEPATGMGSEFTDLATASAALRESASELAAAIRALPDEGLAAEYQTPRGTVIGENLIVMAWRNMAYHAGQVNYIQSLYGDDEFHAPSQWR